MGTIYLIKMRITTHYPMYEGTSYDDELVGDWVNLYGVQTKEQLEKELGRLRLEADRDTEKEKASGKAYTIFEYDYDKIIVY